MSHAVTPGTADRRSVARPLWRQLAGDALRERRRAAGLRLRDVARRGGMSVQYLSEVERGRKEPSSEMLESICGALGWDLVDLVRAVGRRLAVIGGQAGRAAAATRDGALHRFERVAGGGAGDRPDADGARAGITVTAIGPRFATARPSRPVAGRRSLGTIRVAA